MKNPFIVLMLAVCVATSAQTTNGGITEQMLSKIEKAGTSMPQSKALFNAVAANNIDELAKNFDNGGEIDTYFSIETPKQTIHDQKSSGRCWMFSGLNVLRSNFARRHNDTLRVEYSHAYLFFYDQLEKANLMLQGTIDNASKPIDDQRVQFFFHHPINDGGTFCGVSDLAEKYGLEDSALVAAEQFGPSVGNELKQNAIMAVVIASIGMLIYIIFRFKSWKYGLCAVAGVAHDVLMVLAFYAIFGYTINNPFIAAILTLVGYSINDTIVIFDRIRDNKRLRSRGSLEENIDLSLNQTLNRTIMTSLTTLVVMVPLLVMVSSAISQFIVPLMVGVIVGCYSSIFICSPMYYDLNKKDEMSKYMLKQQEKVKTEKKTSRAVRKEKKNK